MEPLEKFQQVYLSEEEEEAISANRNTIIHGAENFGFVPINENISGKESTNDQELGSYNRVDEIAIYNKMWVCHNQEVQCEQAILHSDSTLHCKRA